MVANVAAMPSAQYHFVRIVGYLLCLYVLDCIVCCTKLGSIARWQSLHTFANFFISCFSVGDFIRTMMDPISSCLGVPVTGYSLQPVYIIIALHTYHMLPFLGFRLKADDYFHHLLFGGVIGSAGVSGLVIQRTGAIQNFVAFFICGLPGFLDYAMLVMVKLGYFTKEEEKTWNARINVWVRSPGLMGSACIMYISVLYGPLESPCRAKPVLTLLCAFLILFNGQYYLQVVVGNTFRKVKTYNS